MHTISTCVTKAHIHKRALAIHCSFTSTTVRETVFSGSLVTNDYKITKVFYMSST